VEREERYLLTSAARRLPRPPVRSTYAPPQGPARLSPHPQGLARERNAFGSDLCVLARQVDTDDTRIPASADAQPSSNPCQFSRPHRLMIVVRSLSFALVNNKNEKKNIFLSLCDIKTYKLRERLNLTTPIDKPFSAHYNGMGGRRYQLTN